MYGLWTCACLLTVCREGCGGNTGTQTLHNLQIKRELYFTKAHGRACAACQEHVPSSTSSCIFDLNVTNLAQQYGRGGQSLINSHTYPTSDWDMPRVLLEQY